MVHSRLLTLGIVLLALAPAAAQTRPPRDTARPRDTTVAAEAGSAVVRGRVVDPDGAPIGNVVVTARVPLPNAAERSVTTGGDGRFEFRNLPQMPVTLTASRNGYSGRNGQRDAQRSVTLGAIELHENIDIVLVRSGVIVGLISGPDGEPLVGAQVQALLVRRTAQGRRLGFGGASDTTDDRGAYRLHGLAPGPYHVTVTPPRPRRVSSASSPSEATGLAPTYYPGTRDPSQAVTVMVTSGGEAAADMTVPESALHTVSGYLIDPEGRPASRASVGLRSRSLLEGDVLTMSHHATVRDDGSFVMERVPPGSYTLQARVYHQGLAPQGVWQPTPSGEAHVDVSGDIQGLQIRLTLGATVRGRVSFATTPPDDLTAVRVGVRSRDSYGLGSPPPVNLKADGTFEISGVRGRVTFTVMGGRPPRGGMVGGLVAGVDRTGVARQGAAGAAARTAPSEPVITQSWGGAMWRTRAVRAGGRTLPDQELEIGADELMTGVEVDVAQDHASVRGIVRDERGSPLRDAAIVVIAVDDELARKDEWAIRGRARSTQDGRFAVAGLPPGTWDLLAVPEMPVGSFDETEAIVEPIRHRATRVTLTESQHLEIDLTIVRP